MIRIQGWSGLRALVEIQDGILYCSRITSQIGKNADV